MVLLICPCAADGYSIYIKGLPMNATVSLLENEFKRFGPIRNGGIQVRSNRVCTYYFFFKIFLCGCFIFSWQHNYIVSSLQQQGFCFGFVEFEVPTAVQKALEVCFSS